MRIAVAFCAILTTVLLLRPQWRRLLLACRKLLVPLGVGATCMEIGYLLATYALPGAIVADVERFSPASYNFVLAAVREHSALAVIFLLAWLAAVLALQLLVEGRRMGFLVCVALPLVFGSVVLAHAAYLHFQTTELLAAEILVWGTLLVALSGAAARSFPGEEGRRFS